MDTNNTATVARAQLTHAHRVHKEGLGYVTLPLTREECAWYIRNAEAAGGTGYSIQNAA